MAAGGKPKWSENQLLVAEPSARPMPAPMAKPAPVCSSLFSGAASFFSVFFVVHYFPFAYPSLPPLGQGLLCLEYALDEPQQKWVGRLGHLAVIVAVQLHDRRVRVADNLHHAPEIRVFLVAAEHLQLAIAGDQ